MRELLRRLHYFLNRRRFDAELADEMAFHREMAARSGGMPLGNTLRLREESREAWGLMWLERLLQDLKYAFRAMRSSPGFTASAVLVLSIGIGATVAAFSAFNMTLQPLPVRDPDSLLRFRRVSQTQSSSEVPYPAFAFYREHARTLAAVIAQKPAEFSLDNNDEPVRGLFVTSNFFDDLGATTAHGRLLNVNDARPDAPPAIVLGYGFWASHFGSDASAVGRTVRLNGKVSAIVGVAGRKFPGLGAEGPALWAPIEHHTYFVAGSDLLTDFSGRQNGGVRMWGRLAPGVSQQAAEDELAGLAAGLRQQRPADIWEGERLRGEPGASPQLLGAETVFALVAVLALLILVVACGNLGSLLLARGASRQREMALRSAIGAGTGRLIRQLFTESLALALLGCTGGLFIGWVVLKGLMVWSAAPPWLDPSPDWLVVSFALLIGFLSAIFFGLAPALHVARQKVQRSRATVTRSVLIAAQVASSCVLLIVGGLLMRSFDRAVSADPGFEYERVVVIEPALLEHGYTSARSRVYIQNLIDRVRAIPGVEDVSISSTPPLGDSKIIAQMKFEEREFNVFINQVDARYLKTMKIQLLRGRDLGAGDDRGVVISESLALRNWPGREALGQSVKIGNESLTVVGIARSAPALEMSNPETGEMYRLAKDEDLTSLSVLARTAGPSAPLAPAFNIAANSVDPDFKARVYLLKDRYNDHLANIFQSAVAVSVLGFVALAVACLGVVGLVAYAVAARTKEIGIRLALGARPSHVVGSLVNQFLFTVVAGLAAGVIGAYGLAQLLRTALYGVSTIDPTAYLGAIALFLAAIGLAGLWPARRALKVDPLVALKTD